MAAEEDRKADLDLVRDALSRERRAVDRFMERMMCVPRFLAVQNRTHGGHLDDQDLRDLTQTVLAVVWRKLADYEGRAALETWVYRIAKFELLNEVRRRERAPSLLGEEAAEHVPEDRRESDRMDYDRLYEALERLDPVEAAVIRLKHFEHLTFNEAAESLGVPPETAKTRYYRGLRRMERWLRPRLGEEEA